MFLLGSWDVILELARFIESEFKRFVKSKDITISFGIALAKPSKPISYLAHETEHLLEESKDLIKKGVHYTHFFSVADYCKELGIVNIGSVKNPHYEDERWNSAKGGYAFYNKLIEKQFNN